MKLTPAPRLATVSGELIPTLGQARVELYGTGIDLVVVKDLEGLDSILGIDTLNRLDYRLSGGSYGTDIELAGRTVRQVSGQQDCSLAGVEEVTDSRIAEVLKEYLAVFCETGDPLTEATGISPMLIQTEGPPVYQRPYRAPIA